MSQENNDGCLMSIVKAVAFLWLFDLALDFLFGSEERG